MSLFGHLEELRKRIIVILIGIVAVALVSFGYADDILAFVTAPAGKLIFTAPAEAFMTQLKLSLMVALFLTSPLILHQTAVFVWPGLRGPERRLLTTVFFFAPFLFAAGVTFGFVVALPVTYNFFIRFAAADLQPMITVANYLSFLISLTVPFGLVFQLPMVSWGLTRAGIIEPGLLRRQRRFALLIIAVVAAAITPPDVFSQLVMGLPLWILYEISIVVSTVAARARLRRLESESESESEED
ncbi:MAG: twin-arginine translocase subunit TatC [Firmicutes bacterium]|nr:twin-arginine translocase subunit TatC [Bacillota bacterium]